MGESIESFVTKLQEEGIEAGKRAAEELRSEARQQGEKTIAEAKAQAERLIADANSQAEKLLARSVSELELAARDVLLRLREGIERAISAVLAGAATDRLNDSDFLSRTLHDLVLLYAKADIDRKETMRVNVSPELQARLAGWAIREITRKAEEAGMGIDLRGTLQTAGFEYSISGATVEVTPESVVETMSELISPRLREIVDAAVRNAPAGRPKATE